MTRHLDCTPVSATEYTSEFSQALISCLERHRSSNVHWCRRTTRLLPWDPSVSTWPSQKDLCPGIEIKDRGDCTAWGTCSVRSPKASPEATSSFPKARERRAYFLWAFAMWNTATVLAYGPPCAGPRVSRNSMSSYSPLFPGSRSFGIPFWWTLAVASAKTSTIARGSNETLDRIR